MKLRLLTLLTGLIFLLGSCSDGSGELTQQGTARLQVSLVDDPAAYDAVLIDVEGLEYKIETDTSESDDDGENANDDSGDDDDNGTWVTMDIEPRIYDLLQLNNGDEALLADINISTGELKEIRLKLGDDNHVVIDGDTLDLTVPSGSSSGLKLKVDEDIEAGESYKLTIDFDAALSITETGNGMYILRPVIRVSFEVLDADDFGSISGVVSPDSVASVVYVIEVDEEDTLATMPEADGTFLFSMLEPATYHVVAVPSVESGLNQAAFEGVIVTAGEINALDTLKFTE